MLVSDVQKILDAECICCENLIDTEIKSASNRGEEYKVKMGESIGVRI